MLNLNQSLFEERVPEDCQVVFVADLFEEDYIGGAELTTQALIDSCNLKYFKIKSRDLTFNHIKTGRDKFWIFGNFAQLNVALITPIVVNLSYAICEFDYKFCFFRSIEKHKMEMGQDCDCHQRDNGKIVNAFFEAAKIIFWMSEKQMSVYHSRFPSLLNTENVVLSSVFSPNTLGKIKILREKIKDDKIGWIVLDSDSWVKGTQAAVDWCQKNNLKYEVVGGISYDEMLLTFAKSKGFVYLPLGGDTCPRMVIEAKLLGCELKINENVQHAQEDWFLSKNIEEIEEYLYGTPVLFWKIINSKIEYIPTISGYTTSFNCIEQDYPIKQCINSMLSFCDEVCIVDAGSQDGTWEMLLDLANSNKKIKIQQIKQDTSDPRFAVKIDGQLKAASRKMCTSDFCWQMDSDEIVDIKDADKIKNICKIFPNHVDVLSLPVIEYWGSLEKVRIDVNPWKWRLSKNKENIIHGIPIDLRKYDKNGELYAASGTDSCDLIDSITGQRIDHVTFVTQESEAIRYAALSGNTEALILYQNWFDAITSNVPSIHHYSWYNMERKIKQYKNYWCKFWPSMYGQKFEDTAENNVMFDVPWSQVTEGMISKRAKVIANKLGGWIWHEKWDGITTTPSITLTVSKDLINDKK
jgi:glycosyltransferase involved in cell wall biosynthesis